MAASGCAWFLPLVMAVALAASALGAPPPNEHPRNPSKKQPPRPAEASHELSLPPELSLSTDLEPRPPPPLAITDVTHPRCAHYFCSIELCLPIEDCDGVVVDSATECGCCPLCVKYLDAGRSCGRHGVLRFPERPTTMCRPPLRCVDGYCAKEEETPRRGAHPAPALPHPAPAFPDRDAHDRDAHDRNVLDQ